jgi:SAM-dependent methyltransferase
MVKWLIEFYKRQLFFVNFASIFINPNYFSRKGLLKYIRKESPNLSGRLLDFGSGRKPWRSLFQVDEYVGVDIEESGHDHGDSRIDFYYDGHVLPFETHSFDCVFASDVFEHLFNLDEMLDELNRVLKPEGQLLVTIPFAWNEHEIPYDFARYTSYGIRSVLEKHGFEIVRLHKTTTYFETVCQSFNNFVIENIFPKNKVLRTLLMIILTGPLTLVSVLLNYILPDNKAWYLSMVLLAKKKIDVGNFNEEFY